MVNRKMRMGQQNTFHKILILITVKHITPYFDSISDEKNTEIPPTSKIIF